MNHVGERGTPVHYRVASCAARRGDMTATRGGAPSHGRHRARKQNQPRTGTLLCRPLGAANETPYFRQRRLLEIRADS